MGVGKTYVLINSQCVISDHTSTTNTHATVARTSLVVREVSFRIVSNSAMVVLYSGLLTRIGIQLNVCPPIFLAAFWCCVRVQGLIGAIPGDPEARSREAVFFHQVLLYGIGTLARELHVVAALAGRVSIAFDIDDRILIGAHLSADFVD